MPLLDDLEALRTQAVAAFAAAADAKALEAVRVEYLGNRGKLKGLLGRMGEIPKEQRAAVGKRANELSTEVQGLFDAAKTRLESAAPSTAAGSSLEALKQERLAKLKLYEEKMGKGSAWGGRFPEASTGKALTSIEKIRAAFAKLDKAKDIDPKAAAGEDVYLAARVTLRRDQSKKFIFLTVQDQTGSIQVALWNAMLDENTLSLLRDTLDLWDILGLSGKLAYTQKGEPTVWATSARLLSKCIAPPPDKRHGIHDKEIRYRQRYLDLIAEPASRQTFILRAKAVSGVRRFLDEQGFLEMETPVLQLIPGGAAARPFETRLNALDMKMYMRIATEIPLKKLLVGGLEKVYELGRIFRNEGIDTRHNPEFTTVELYQAYADLRDMMTLTETLVSKLAQELHGSTTVTFRGRELKLAAPWPRKDYCELLKQHAGVTPDDESGLDAKLKEKGRLQPGMPLVDKIEGVFGEYVEPHLQDACFIINQPIEMSPLCKAHPENPKLADRFEAFAGAMEIANAYSELNNPVEQRSRLKDQTSQRLFEDKFELLDISRSPALQSEEALKGIQILKLLNYALIIELADEYYSEPGWDQEFEKDIRNPQHRSYVINELQYAIKSSLGIVPSPYAFQDPRVRHIAELHCDPSLRLDTDFLSALEHGMPPAGGLGIGIDRVVMLLAGVDSIRDVILFPLMRPE